MEKKGSFLGEGMQKPEILHPKAQFFNLFVIFFMDEPIGWFSPVQGEMEMLVFRVIFIQFTITKVGSICKISADLSSIGAKG